MSTRSSVTFIGLDNKIADETKHKEFSKNFYHHCDGYPTGVGIELFNLIQNNLQYFISNWMTLTKIAKNLSHKYEEQKDRLDPFDMGEEYHYIIKALDNGDIVLSAESYKIDPIDIAKWKRYSDKDYILEFVSIRD